MVEYEICFPILYLFKSRKIGSFIMLKIKNERGSNVGAKTQVPVMGKNSDEKQVVL